MLRRMVTPRLLSLPVLFSLVLFAAEAHATPRNGSRELRIGQEFQPPLTLTNGLVHLEPDRGEGVTGLGLGAGMGWFVSDGVELGLSLSLEMLKSGGDTLTGPGATPFVRLMYVQGRVAYFWEVDAGLQRFSSDQIGETVFTVGGDLGLEFFVTDDWAVRVAPTFRHVLVSLSRASVIAEETAKGNRFGVIWGLACYF
jgi:hypothetical protein